MYGLNIDPNNPKGNPPAHELMALGVDMVRYTYHDHSAGFSLDPVMVEFYQDRMRDDYNAGIATLFILTYDTLPNKPGFDAPAQEWEIYTENFVYRVEQIARIFAPVPGTAFQIWNEPDLAPAPGYEPSLKEPVYGRMLRYSREAIKRVSPQTLVVGAGLASGDPSWWKRVVASQPGAPLLDVNALHPYGQRPSPDWPAPDWGFGYVGDLIKRYQLEAFNGPWWITESGVNSLSDEGQGEYLRRMYQTIKGLEQKDNEKNGVKWLFWFCYADGMVSPYGLRDGAGVPKPAYGAYAGMTAAAEVQSNV